MRHRARPINRARPALQCAGTARRSLLLTFVVLVSIATLGHILGVYQPMSGSEWRGISVIPLPGVPPHTPPLPDYQEPAEQSTPDIPFTRPQLVSDVIEIPDICTTPEETLTNPPLIDMPESLNAPMATARKTTTHPKPRRSQASAAPVALSEVPATPPMVERCTPPTYKTASPPPYPAEMRASRVRGVVRVRIAVNPAGVPTAVQITASSGHRLFDTTATSWILRYWRFNPATRSGVPVASSVNTRVEFILDNA